MGNPSVKKKHQLVELIDKLSCQNSVLKVTHNYFFIKVTFRTGITEYWALNDKALKKRRHNIFLLPSNGPYFISYPNTYSQFETNPLDNQHQLLKDHFIIKRADIKQAGWCDIRCKIHDMILDLCNQGWVDIQYSNDILEQDLLELKNDMFEKHKSTLIRHYVFHGHTIGRRLVLNFMPTLAKNDWEAYPIYRSLNKLFGGLYDITRESIVYDMSLKCHVVRFPGFYRSIFNQWYNIAGKHILDLYPDWGFKALSVMVDGGYYYHTSEYEESITKMAKFMGGSVELHRSNNHYDLAMISDIHPISLVEVDERINKYSSIADNLMVTISKADWQKALDLYKPWRILRIKDVQGKTANEDNYVFIIGQR